MFYTVETGVNDRLYFRLVLANGGAPYDYIITLEAKDYSGNQFATEIQSKITGVTNGAATVCVYDSNQSRQMSVSVANLDINFFTDAELSEPHFNIGWGGTAYDTNNLSSGNELLSNVFTNVLGNTSSPAKYYGHLIPVGNIYMRSPNLSSFNTIGPDGESSIIKKIPVNAEQGQMITSYITSSTNFIPCNNLALKTIEIQLYDVNGNLIQPHGTNWSFSILFDIINSDQ
jgi:hypothetical protein